MAGYRGAVRHSALDPPFTLLSIYDEKTENSEDEKTSKSESNTLISSSVLLESCCMYIKNGDMFSRQYNIQNDLGTKDYNKDPPISAISQSYILDCVTCPMLAAKDITFVLACEFSVLLCFKQSKTGAFFYAEVVESLFSEEVLNEFQQKNTTAPPVVIHFNESLGVLVIIALNKVILVTINLEWICENYQEFERMSLDPDNETEFLDCVRGTSIYDLSQLMKYSFNKLFSNMPTASKKKQDLEGSIIESNVEHCSIWKHSADDACATLVCSGNGSWVEFINLKRDNEHKMWYTLTDLENRKEYQLEKDQNQSLSLSHKQEDLEFVLAHTSWVTSICEGDTSEIGVTGDSSGHLFFWEPRNGGGGQRGYKKLFKTFFTNDSITSIQIDSNTNNKDCFWIGNSSGTLTYSQVSLAAKKLQELSTVRFFQSINIPTIVEWRGVWNQESDVGRLRMMSNYSGVAVECHLTSNIIAIFNGATGPIEEPKHSSIIELCSVLSELEIIVTAGDGNVANVWNLLTCQLISTIVVPDLSISCIASFDNGYVQDGVGRILFGHANGTINSYLIVDTQQPQNTNNNSALNIKSPSVTCIDILDTLQNEPSEGIGVIDDPSLESASLANTQEPEFVEEEKMLQFIQQDTYSYSPLPVTKIIFSSLGLYFCFSFANQNIVVHDWESNKALVDLQFDQTLTSIGGITSDSSEEIHNDSIILVLQSKESMKFFDAIKGCFIQDMSFDTSELQIKKCAMWDYTTNDIGGHSMKALFVENGFQLNQFDEYMEYAHIPSQQEDVTTIENRNGYDPLENLVVGINGVNASISPLASVWGLRRAIVIRFSENVVLKTVNYHVKGDKVRFIEVSPLKVNASIRANRAAVILSDGTVAIMRL